MSITTTEQKKLLRREIARREAQLSPAQRRRSDDALLRRFLALPELDSCRTVLLFWGMGAEPETQRLLEPLLRQGKMIGLPRCLPEGEMVFLRYCGQEHLARHPYGMMEPEPGCPGVDIGRESLMLVPAVCYDWRCLRLGRGGGYYDRFLSRYEGRTVGLCRDALLQRQCPSEPHDRGVEMVLTETRTLLRPADG